MLVLALASCGGNKTPDVTNKPSGGDVTTGGQADENKWKNVNFDGETIIISLSNQTRDAVTAMGATNAVKYIQGPDNYTTDPVQNAVYDRNLKVMNQLGLNVEYQLCEQYTYNPDDALKVIENFVLADLEDSPDIISATSYGIIRGGIKGYLHNALSTEQENYFDLTEENGWYPEFMYENTLDESKIYMLTSDYFIDVLRCAYGVMVNLDMYDELFAAEGGTDSLFEMIEAGNWNYDEFMRCVDTAYVDNAPVGQIDENDVLGAINAPSWLARASFSASGLDIFETAEDGSLRYIEDITDVHNFVDKLINLTKTNGFYLNLDKGPLPRVSNTAVFMNGNVLFGTDSYVLTLEGTQIQNMDDKSGIIPYPKYNPDEPYRSLVSDEATVGGVLYNSDKFTECSAFLQMATEESNGGVGTLIYEYYEVTLKYKLSSTPQQVTMLEYIRSGLTCPKAILLDNFFAKNIGASTVGALFNQSLGSGMNTFASDWESQYDAVQGSLETTAASYGN